MKHKKHNSKTFKPIDKHIRRWVRKTLRLSSTFKECRVNLKKREFHEGDGC